jgi:hypothetical protein
LSIASASRYERIGRFDGVHNCASGRGTRNNSATRTEVIRETLSNDSGASRWRKAWRRLRTSAAIPHRLACNGPNANELAFDFDPVQLCCPHEDHGPVISFNIDRLRWRSAESANEMRRRLGGFIKSIYNAPPRRGRDGNGPDQPLLRKLTARPYLEKLKLKVAATRRLPIGSRSYFVPVVPVVRVVPVVPVVRDICDRDRMRD